MELGDGTLWVAREPSELDRRVVEFTEVLTAAGVDYVIVSGYVAILTGRSRATEDIDVIIEPLSEERIRNLVGTFRDSGFWGMAMPLDEMYSMLREDDRIRIARQDELYPNFAVWFASNDVARAALTEALIAEFDDERIRISPIELQIAYKLRLAAASGSTAGTDFEDALHLFLTFEDRFTSTALDHYVQEFGIEDHYDELRRA